MHAVRTQCKNFPKSALRHEETKLVVDDVICLPCLAFKNGVWGCFAKRPQVLEGASQLGAHNPAATDEFGALEYSRARNVVADRMSPVAQSSHRIDNNLSPHTHIQYRHDYLEVRKRSWHRQLFCNWCQ